MRTQGFIRRIIKQQDQYQQQGCGDTNDKVFMHAQVVSDVAPAMRSLVHRSFPAGVHRFTDKSLQ
jgi:hypothetical protein